MIPNISKANSHANNTVIAGQKFRKKTEMVLETLAVLSGVKELFMYNRQSFKFNKTLYHERLYHLQKIRVEQVKLYRDDIRDLFDLVVGKMNNYYLINTLALGFSLGFYYEGKVPDDIPSWLYWLWAMSLGSAIVFLFLSVWFAVHASVIAQMFLTRLLTQWLRLPVPGPKQIDAGAPKLEEFEKVSANESLRVPVIDQAVDRLRRRSSDPPLLEEIPAAPMDPATTADALVQEGYHFYMGHFYMFARLQKHWMNLDAYCRVCMVVGCNQILNAVTYTGLAYFALEDSQWGTVSFVFVPIIFACIHVQLNLLLSRKESICFLTIHSLAPLLASVAAVFQMIYTNDNQAEEGANVAQGIAIGSYVCHFVSCACLLVWGLQLHDGLPIRFTTVNYIDVLGLLAKKASKYATASTVVEKEEPAVASVVPLAEGMKRADDMYQSFVADKVGNNVFATQAAMPKASVRLVSSVLKHRSSVSGDIHGPRDYAPTIAQLSAPDVMARMPHVAYRLVGITILLLWAVGIVIGLLQLADVSGIGWSNIISPAS